MTIFNGRVAAQESQRIDGDRDSRVGMGREEHSIRVLDRFPSLVELPRLVDIFALLSPQRGDGLGVVLVEGGQKRFGSRANRGIVSICWRQCTGRRCTGLCWRLLSRGRSGGDGRKQ